MCWCTPEIRTPNCGKIGCHPPRDEIVAKNLKIAMDALDSISDFRNPSDGQAATIYFVECRGIARIARSKIHTGNEPVSERKVEK